MYECIKSLLNYVLTVGHANIHTYIHTYKKGR